ncbi:MAG: hypothetical protein IID37_11230 [Planctomycetes bacterium]|nr:hypothetical protein [Planctomycetota bacterium]
MPVEPNRDHQSAAVGGQVIEPIRLAGGWSGHVLTGVASLPDGGNEPLALPSVDDWPETLSTLLGETDPNIDCEILKHSENTRVFRGRLSLGNRTIEVIAKQRRVVGALPRLASLFRLSRERHNWERALLLGRIGVPTALPLAILERTRPQRESWLITWAIPGVVDLQQFALMHLSPKNSSGAHRVKSILTDRIVDLFARLDRNGLHHRDMKGSNILVTGCDGPVEQLGIWLVDLDGLHRSQQSQRRRWQPVVRLAVSLQPYSSITRTDAVRFLRRYLERLQLPADSWRRRWPRLAARVQHYAAQSRKRKRQKLDGFDGA